jgi:uncharacterized protein with NAD-binding domain and iron-sulfur cluster
MTLKVAIFGAGIAGMTTAHELIRLGYNVSIYETTDKPGGFFRSSRTNQGNLPTEYSWHGMGPWYHNTFDLMKQIPFNEKGTLYDLALSRPIDFGIFPNNGKAQFYDKNFLRVPKMFEMNYLEFINWFYLMFKTWTSNDRSKIKYAKLNAAESWNPLLKMKAYSAWRSCFGPWVGSDWSKVSLHTVGDFFKKQLTTKPEHQHLADLDGPAWKQGAGDGWLLLKGPSSEYWFNPWMKYLQEKGVNFYWGKTLTKLDFDGKNIIAAFCHEEKIVADLYVVAINPFMMSALLSDTPILEKQEELKKFKPLIQDGPHTQVSFRLAFNEKINFPRQRVAVVLSDSEFNLTLFAEEQVWDENVDLGNKIKSIWTGTSCISSVPGCVYHKPVNNCTKAEFIDEIKTQILNCGSLNEQIKEANNGKELKEFLTNSIIIEVWHEWDFSIDGIRPFQPKWVTTTNTQAYLPSQKTPVLNLYLAGAHTKTQAQVWSIEGAVESGRRAAKAIDFRIKVIDQHNPNWFKLLASIDDILFLFKAPQIIDSFLIFLGFILFYLFFK